MSGEGEFWGTDLTAVLRQTINDMIIARDAALPRHRQKSLGVSDWSNPCWLKLAMKTLGIEGDNPGFDPLPSIIGTAVHASLAEAGSHANLGLGRKRWHTETRVNPAPWMRGTADLYDADTQTVVDYKVLGHNSFKTYKREMAPAYRTQVHLYGRGFRNAGVPVENVAVMLIPRSGTLASSYLWLEPYDDAIADEAIKRHDLIIGMLKDLDVENRPERLACFPKSGPNCFWCPFWSPNPEGPYQCAGVDDDIPLPAAA